MRQRLILSFKLAVAIGLIAWLAATGRIDVTRLAGAVGNPGCLMIGVFCSAMAVVVPMVRYHVLARLQLLPLRFSDTLRVNMIGNFFNVFIPGGTGGDVVRAAYTVRWSPGRPAGAVALPFIDRGLGLHALLVLAVCAPVVDPELYVRAPGLTPWSVLSAGLLVGGTLIAMALAHSKACNLAATILGRLIGGRQAWVDSMRRYREAPGPLVFAYALSLASAACNVLAIHFMVRAAGSNPSFGKSLAVAPLVIVANTLPLSPGGIGVAEGASATLYAMAGAPGGADGMLLVRAVILLVALCGLPIFIAGRRQHTSKPDFENSAEISSQRKRN